MSKSPDKDVMFEGRKAWDLAPEIRTVVECVGEELRSTIESLKRISRLTDEELRRHFYDQTHDVSEQSL